MFESGFRTVAKCARPATGEMIMPTNRKRISRISNRVPVVFTDAYKADLKMKDFLGILSEAEILIAKELGLYHWDGWVKEQRKG